MRKRLTQNKHGPGQILIILLFLFIFASTSVADNNQKEKKSTSSDSSSKLSISVSMDDSPILKSRNTQGKKDNAFVLDTDAYTFNQSGITFDSSLYSSSLKNNEIERFNRTVKTVASFFIRYFHNSGSESSSSKDSNYFMKSKSPGKNVKFRDFDVNLSFDVGTDRASIVKMNSVKAESYLFSTYFNAMYSNETDDLEFGITNDFLNSYLGDGIRLEFMTNPLEGAGGLLLSVEL